MSSIKLSVSSYSFKFKPIFPYLTLKKAIITAKEMGFDGVELVDNFRGSQESRLKKAAKLRILSEKLGIPIVSFTFGADLLNGSGGDVEKEITKVCRQLDIAKVLNAERVRHDVVYSVKEDVSYPDILDRLVYATKKITLYAKSLEIKTCVENHGFYFQDIDKIESLINGVGDPNFGLLGDMGNFLCGDIQPEDAFSALAKYMSFVHAKDFYYSDTPKPSYFKTRGGNYLCGATIGDGVVPADKLISILKRNAYSGYLSIEFEGKGKPLTEIARSKAYLESLIK